MSGAVVFVGRGARQGLVREGRGGRGYSGIGNGEVSRNFKNEDVRVSRGDDWGMVSL
jgi:hypothetical protein